mmetsp:Transcript_23501/g.49624  ORF Transcript_23501/g.49624 Transcript_23501/m.49624 type:complete len:632 (-) Transcript_23501:458-2353(-)|eukprot:CAMPEP_0171331050 /NCGR_PEP_ID=MMETSP0878-20121228/2434_1 /TAXON_ID=67004 /ORGANISM="Thalassiosira weissflogii, Strain CCMP1336" /LENGTH=631 /DNA_ID=CAMNT_0011831501 /DNA_START=352 /DNA_END=2247 /DNA_ORIENTATION=+
MSSSAFSFHCMICFEEFDPHTNYPVVLPCGHTYVCISCANRLDKCMECRTPLFIKIEAPPPPPDSSPDFPNQKENRHDDTRSYNPSIRSSPAGLRASTLSGSRVLTRQGGNYAASSRGYDRSMNKPPPPSQPVKKERLPLPKNAVLLSLIQASEPARRRTENQAPQSSQFPFSPEKDEQPGSCSHGPPKFSKPSPLFLDSSSSGENDNEDDEEHKIKVGTYLSGGPCGTYAVAVKSGLFVYPTLFEHTLQPINDVVSRDVEEIVKTSYKLKHQHQQPSSDDPYSIERSQTWVDGPDEEQRNGQADLRVETKTTIPPPTHSNRAKDVLGTIDLRPAPKGTMEDNMPCSSRSPTLKTIHRQFSHGSNPFQKDFDRPLLRLKYGDRVQVVSMDSRGLVKLARGYGYIRLENEKQLVKVGGSSDSACQIEAMLHELSIERNRLKHEQQKLERLSSGLMIDLQSSLLADEDHVIEPAPEGMPRSDSDLSIILPNKMDRQPSNVSVDDIDLSLHSRQILTSPRSFLSNTQDSEQPREIRTAKSHSPGRVASNFPLQSTPNKNEKAPQSPGASYSPQQFVTNTPTRVNFRTGLSGHRALTSSFSHPHDFIDYRGQSRSMSNHAGLSSKKTSTRGRSNY